jgi:dTDP-4-dehydrorhamnose 3,5-epimerase
MKSGSQHQPIFTLEQGWLEGAVKDRQSITSDWVPQQALIQGVRVKEIKNVVNEQTVLTEIFRRDWELDAGPLEQVFQIRLTPGKISAWHAHQWTTDRFFISQGLIKIVLYDARQASDTHGQINELRFGTVRPALIIVPPGIWHGVQNLADEPSFLLNLVDCAYDYEDPDHWRLPWNTPVIPYSFAK